MKLILTHEVTGLGDPGDVVDVKPGYARNFLVPRGLATVWTRGAEKNIESIRKARAARDIHDLEGAQSVKGNLEAKPITISAKAGNGGRLFGAITSSDVAEAVKAGGVDVDKRRIEIPTPIKSTGQHSATVRLHPEVVANLTLEVVAV